MPARPGTWGSRMSSVEGLRRARRVVPIVSVQNRYSLSHRSWENVLVECEKEGI